MLDQIAIEPKCVSQEFRAGYDENLLGRVSIVRGKASVADAEEW